MKQSYYPQRKEKYPKNHYIKSRSEALTKELESLREANSKLGKDKSDHNEILKDKEPLRQYQGGIKNKKKCASTALEVRSLVEMLMLLFPCCSPNQFCLWFWNTTF